MEHPVLGVIGGMGPGATACFMERVLEMTWAEREQEHLDMIVYNCPSIPDRTAAILDPKAPSPLPKLLAAAGALEAQGVDQIAIPCVTAHHYYDQLAQAVSTPVIHGVRETAAYLKELGVVRAGVLATDGTLAAGLFDRALEARGIEPVYPSRFRQQDVMELIYRCVKAGRRVDPALFDQVGESLRRQGAEVIVLGCTELSLMKSGASLGPGYLDVLDVLARQAVLRCGKPLKARLLVT